MSLNADENGDKKVLNESSTPDPPASGRARYSMFDGLLGVSWRGGGQGRGSPPENQDGNHRQRHSLAPGQLIDGLNEIAHRKERTLSVRQAQRAYLDAAPKDADMMGPILRRKRVSALPLAGPSLRGAEHFQDERRRASTAGQYKQEGTSPEEEEPKPILRRRRASSIIDAMIQKKQVRLDLYAPEEAELFAARPDQEEKETVSPTDADQVVPTHIHEESEDKTKKPSPTDQLFLPLRFSPPVGAAAAGTGSHGPPPKSTSVDIDLRAAFDDHQAQTDMLKHQIAMLTDKVEENNASGCEDQREAEYLELLEDIESTQFGVDMKNQELRQKLLGPEKGSPGLLPDTTFPGEISGGTEDEEGSALLKQGDEYDDSHIIKATRSDLYCTGFLWILLIAFTGAVLGWDTHLDETYSTFGAVGLGCATPCKGDLSSQDYFHGHSHFETNEYVQLTMQLDPHPGEDVEAVAYLIGEETGQLKATLHFGPPSSDGPVTQVKKTKVNFDHPHEAHIIDVNSTRPDITLSYKLDAHVLSPLAGQSELIAALIMIFVYLFILLEVIHRTLVAIFGSMVALMFLFIMHGVSRSESVERINTSGYLAFELILTHAVISSSGTNGEYCYYHVAPRVEHPGSFVRHDADCRRTLSYWNL